MQGQLTHGGFAFLNLGLVVSQLDVLLVNPEDPIVILLEKLVRNRVLEVARPQSMVSLVGVELQCNSLCLECFCLVLTMVRIFWLVSRMILWSRPVVICWSASIFVSLCSPSAVQINLQTQMFWVAPDMATVPECPIARSAEERSISGSVAAPCELRLDFTDFF